MTTLAAQSAPAVSDGSLSGTREVSLLVIGRVLSTEYSVSDDRSAIGGSGSFASHINRFLAVQGGLGIAYSTQEGTFYKPRCSHSRRRCRWSSDVTTNEFQPYALVGAVTSSSDTRIRGVIASRAEVLELEMSAAESGR
jgi:hypothetical protein